MAIQTEILFVAIATIAFLETRRFETRICGTETTMFLETRRFDSRFGALVGFETICVPRNTAQGTILCIGIETIAYLKQGFWHASEESSGGTPRADPN